MTDIIGKAVGFLLGVVALSGLVAGCACAFVRSRGRAHRIETENEAARWARLNGGNRDYRGGMKRPRVEVVQNRGELRARLIDQSVEKASAVLVVVLTSGMAVALMVGWVS